LTASEIIALRSPDDATHANLEDFIEQAEELTLESVYGDQYNLAVALLVLHWLAKEDSGGAAGPITSEKEGDLSRAYSVSASPDDLDSTGWGKELKALRRRKLVLFHNRATL